MEVKEITAGRAMDPDEAIDALVREYDAGRLVPFLGAGMSRRRCPDWKGFIANLERIAGLPVKEEEVTADALARRGMRAVRLMRRRDPDKFAHNVDRAVARDPNEGCPQTEQLARIWWPLVLTTNYDDIYFEAFTKHWEKSRNTEDGEAEAVPAQAGPPMTLVLGRTGDDCQTVLRSLREPSRSILWALHGFLRMNAGAEEPVEQFNRLAGELVIGHEEYRRIVHTAVHFRRAFAEVFRSRSFLFLGSSLTDPHLQGLFDEVLEVAGPTPRPHYAVVTEGAEIPSAYYFSSRLNTILIQIEGHAELPRFLERLRERIDDERPRTKGWSYVMAARPWTGRNAEAATLEIERGGLPKVLAAGECVAVSAGTNTDDRDLQLSGGMRKYLREYTRADSAAAAAAALRTPAKARRPRRGAPAKAAPAEPPAPPRPAMPRLPADKARHVVRYGDEPVFFAAARDRVAGVDRRDLRVIAPTVGELLDTVTRAGFRIVHCQVLAAGRLRSTPAVFQLIEMIRGFGGWARKNPGVPVRFVVQVVARDVLFSLDTGRVDVSGILLSDDVRFWVNVRERQQGVEKRVLSRPPETSIESLVDELDVPRRGWELTVLPSPDGSFQATPVDTAVRWKLNIGQVGVTPHSELIFRASGR